MGPFFSCSTRFVVRRRQFGVGHAPPAFVRVEALYFLYAFRGARSEVLFEHDTIVVHEKGHHAARAILRGVRDQREAADQFAFRKVVVRSAFCVRPLLFKNAEQISVITTRRTRCRRRISLRLSLREEGSEGALRLARRGGPVETVAVALGAPKAMCIVEERIPVGVTGVVLALRVDLGQRRLNG